MHFHICPQEIAVLLMIYDQLQVYFYHYKHIVRTWVFRDPPPSDCEVCDE